MSEENEELKSLVTDVSEGICFECGDNIEPPRIFCCLECEEKILEEVEK